MMSWQNSTRLLGSSTLLFLAAAIFIPTHELGKTAVFGTTFLWGESSHRVNVPEGFVHFIDNWEMVQHTFFGLACVASMAVTLRQRRLGILALLFATLIAFDCKRSLHVNGSDWIELALPTFWIVAAWALFLLFRSLQSLKRTAD